MPTQNAGGRLQGHRTVSQKDWFAARKVLLAKEKAFTRRRDGLSEERRKLPWTRVDKEYLFDGPRGKESLSDLFAGKSQLIIYHFMFAPEWEAGCPHCSFWADNFDGIIVHLKQRDAAMAAVSRAPLKKLEAFKRRMGWSFKWLSSSGSDFNYDFGASFSREQLKSGEALYNFGTQPPGMTDREGTSVFYKDKQGGIFRTYSTYSRGIDMTNAAYHYLDLLPKGRDERGRGQFWVRHHDRYKG
jgi:predicted dithiol-disulfide oxidoreductase (DUF899 family)